MSEVQYKNIKKNFGSVEVLKDINLKIDNQKFVVLLGPSVVENNITSNDSRLRNYFKWRDSH